MVRVLRHSLIFLPFGYTGPEAVPRKTVVGSAAVHDQMVDIGGER